MSNIVEPIGAQRKLPLRMRPDLAVQPMESGGRQYWGVKDPLALRYFQLREEEYAVLTMLDGQTSLEEIKNRFERQFAPRRASTRQLLGFIETLHQESLVISTVPGQASELLNRGRRRQRSARWRAVSNPLAIRFRGVDPAPFLDWLYPRCRWLFSRGFLACCVLLVLAAVGLVLVQFGPLQSRLPGFYDFINARNALWLAVAVAIAKLLHELGHALTCRHFGGECHEMGIMLLAFTPCVYCNVSDAWMLPDKWQRIAIGAAGMCVELVLAAVCTFLWWFSEPGLFNSLCLNLTVVCSVSTLIFNGNPLLRYDAYYMLSDFVEVPNLRQQAAAVLSDGLSRWFLGLDLRSERLLPERGRLWLAAYAAASIVYGWFVTFAILWFFVEVLRPYRLQSLAHLMTAVVVASLVAVPVLRFVLFLTHPFRNRSVKWRRFTIRGALAAAALTGLFGIPWPYRVAVPVTIKPAEAKAVYATVPGKLVSCVREGDAVTSGQVLATLEDRDVQIEIAKLQGDRNQQRLYISNLERRQIADDKAGLLLPVARKSLEDIEDRLQQRLADQKRLVLHAPAAGTVFPPPAQRGAPSAGELHGWSGTPLDPRNLGGFIETGTLVCLVGNRARLDASLVIDQTNIDVIDSGQRVRIQLPELPGRVLWGTVTEIAAIALKFTPRELAASGGLPSRIDESGVARPQSTSYQARVALDQEDAAVLSGATGEARVYVAPQSWGRRLYRYVRRTFRVDL